MLLGFLGIVVSSNLGLIVFLQIDQTRVPARGQAVPVDSRVCVLESLDQALPRRPQQRHGGTGIGLAERLR